MNTQDEISKARQAKERASEKLRNAANLLYGTPAWNTPKCKQYLDELFDASKDADDAYFKLTGKL